MNDDVRVEQQGPVTIVTLNRPEVRNAVDSATAQGAGKVHALSPNRLLNYHP